MPLILQGAIAWGGATALGLSVADIAFPLLVLAGACGIVLLGRRGGARLGAWDQALALLLLVGAGLLLGHDARQSDAKCAAEARVAQRLEVRLDGAAAPGSFVRGALARTDCHVMVALAVQDGAAQRGSIVRVHGGERSESDRGLLVRDARLTVVRGPDALARWRNGVGARLDRQFGPEAPVVRALLIADSEGLDPGIRERFADAGLVHVLSISGLHVAIVGGALHLVFGALRLRAPLAAALAVVVTLLYVLAIGAPPPAARSAALFCATQMTRWWQRPVSPWGTFALGALAPLLEPRTVLNLGWQLSVSGYAAILVSGRVGRRLPAAWRGWRAGMLRELITGVLTTLATAPLVAWHFGRLSLVGTVSNLVAGPVISLLQPTLFAAMLWPERYGGAFLADAARPMLEALDAVALAAAIVPGAAVTVAPTLLHVGAAIAAVCGVLVAGWSRDAHGVRRRAVWVAMVGVVVLAIDVDVTGLRSSGGIEVHLLDVGQGDAVAVRTPRGRWILIDAGRAWRSGDAGRATVIPHLRRRGGALALLVLTHPHADHIGGAASVVRALRPREVRDPAFVAGSPVYREVLEAAASLGVRWQRVRPEERLELDGVEVTFLAPDSAWTAALDDPNEASAVVRLRYGTVRVLLTGDAEEALESWLLDRADGSLAAEVLKVGHHGSRTSSTPRFVDAVAPRLALVSVGEGNRYGHPAPEVMRRLAAQGATVLRTDQLGTIIVRSDGTGLEVEAAGHRWPAILPLPRPR